jgi:hypothetical protein
MEIWGSSTSPFRWARVTPAAACLAGPRADVNATPSRAAGLDGYDRRREVLPPGRYGARQRPMSTRTIRSIGCIPIPVGHEVEVTWYEVETISTGFLGGEKKEVEPIDVPVIRDVETGIRYGFFAHFVERGSYRAGEINVERHVLRSDLSVRDSVRGTVTACSIVSIGFQGRAVDQVETELTIGVA